MLVDTSSDATILKVSSLNDDVDIYSGKDNRLNLAGISGTVTSLGEADCHIKINDEIIEHTVHIVPIDFQLQVDGIIGMDLLNKLGATIHCKERILEINKVKTGNISACNDEIKIATEHLTNKETSELLKLCNAYRDIFKKPDQYLSCTSTVKHEIPVDLSQTPINQQPYRLPEAQKPLVEERIRDMTVNGIIRESTSPWNVPIVLVPKKGVSKTRFCRDYRKLNEVTKSDVHPLPNITEILDHEAECSTSLR